jgi:hypothetical protein
MMRRFLLLMFILMIALLTSTVSAAGSPWSVWLYTRETGTLRQISDAGVLLREVVVPLPAGAAAFPSTVAISHDGNRVAYVARGTGDVPTLLVWDITLDTYVTTYAMPAGARVSLEYYASPNVFSESDGQIAFSYGIEMGGWQVIVLDLNTGSSFVLDSSSSPAVSGGVPSDSFLVPIVQVYRGASVSFNMLPVPSDAFGGQSFVWDTTTSTVTPSVAYTTFGDTLLMTGEFITNAFDPSFPTSTNPDAFPFVQFNTLQVYDPVIGGIFPFYAEAESSLYSARFVQNGERIAAAATRADGSSALLLLERDGTLLGETGAPISSLQGVFDGFVFTTMETPFVSTPGATALYYTETRAGLPATAGTWVWESPTAEFASIVWTSDNFALGPDVPTPWAVLAAPLYAPSFPALGAPPIAPTLTPIVIAPPTLVPTFAPPTIIAPAGLAVGADAFINTTDGDSLRLRSGAGRSFTIIAELTDGTRVTLLEGPRAADGLTWWRVRLADGTSGWVVEFVDGIQTLVPITAG